MNPNRPHIQKFNKRYPSKHWEVLSEASFELIWTADILRRRKIKNPKTGECPPGLSYLPEVEDSVHKDLDTLGHELQDLATRLYLGKEQLLIGDTDTAALFRRAVERFRWMLENINLGEETEAIVHKTFIKGLLIRANKLEGSSPT